MSQIEHQNSHPRNIELETQIRGLGYQVMIDLLKTFPKKAFFTQRFGTFGKNRTKLS